MLSKNFSLIIDKMKKILITGANGQLGKSFSKIHEEEYDILSLSRDQLDITKKSEISKAIESFKPDIILNCAAMTDVDSAELNPKIAKKINADSIKKILELFDGLFIHISTDYVFDGKNGPFKEDAITNPINIYGKSKLYGEEIVKDYAKDWIIVRTNVLFDIGSKASFLSWVINSLKENKKINVVNDQINNPVFTDDLSSIIHLLISKNMRGIYHVGSDTLCSRYEFAKIIGDVWNLDINNIVPIKTSDLKKHTKSYIANRPINSGLSSKFDLPIISLRKSLEKIKNK